MFKTLSIMLLGLALFCSSMAVATTWRVERDGSGDYTVIQPAVDNSAPGDTILIGPGRYTETAPFDPGAAKGWPKPAHIGVYTDGLTFIGTDRDAVIIGPEVADYTPDGPLGLINHVSATFLEVQNMTFENVFEGMYILGRVIVGDCRFQYCEQGISYWSSQGLSVGLSAFCHNSTGIALLPGSENSQITSSVFEGNSRGITNISAIESSIGECVFTNNIAGVNFQQYSSGTISECEFFGHRYAIVVTSESGTHLASNYMSDGEVDLWVTLGGMVTGIGNIFVGGTYATLEFSDRGSCAMHGNHILNSSAHTVLVESYIPPAITINLTANYWGTANPDQIEEWIWDGNDNPAIQAIVDFEPYASGPIGTEKKSWGGVKELYR